MKMMHAYRLLDPKEECTSRDPKIHWNFLSVLTSSNEELKPRTIFIRTMLLERMLIVTLHTIYIVANYMSLTHKVEGAKTNAPEILHNKHILIYREALRNHRI